MRKFTLPFLTIIFISLLSCSKGLSESTAIEIAESTPEFTSTECMLLRINTMTVSTKNSNYYTDGVQIREKRISDEEFHSHATDEDCFLPTILTESEGRIVKIFGDPITMQLFHRFGGVCAGCEYCYEKFAEKGLLTFRWIDEEDPVAKDLGFKRCDIKLTPEGEKYVVEWDYDSKNDGSELISSALNANTGDAVAVKLMQRVYTHAEKITQTENTGVYNLYYYYEMTPFGEVIFGRTDKDKEYKCTVSFYKNSDGEWKLSTAKDDSPNAEKREF